MIGTLFLAYFLDPLAQAGASAHHLAPKRVARPVDSRGLWGFWLITRTCSMWGLVVSNFRAARLTRSHLKCSRKPVRWNTLSHGQPQGLACFFDAGSGCIQIRPVNRRPCDNGMLWNNDEIVSGS